MEKYFKYRWEKFKAYVLSDEFENIWGQMPEESLD